MGLIYVFIGCIFLFNPSYTLIDVLPDAVGLIFIMYGISKLADLDPHAADAMRKTRYAFYVALGKLVCMGLIGVFDSTMIITLSFAAGVLECIFLVPAMTGIFGGIEAVMMRGSEKYLPPERDLKTLTAVFLIIRAAGSFVPDMAAMLAETAGGDVTSSPVDATQISLILNVVFAAATLALGIVWLVGAAKTVRRFNADAEMNDALKARYKREILENADVMLKRKVGRFTLITSAAGILFITFRLNSLFFMPEFLFGAAALAALAFAKEYGSDKKARALAVAFAAVGAGDYAFNVIYSLKYGDLIYPLGVDGFVPFYAAAIASAVATYALFALLMKRSTAILRRMARDSVGLRGAYNDERRKDIDGERVKKISNKLTATDVITYSYAAIGVAVKVLMPFAEAIWLVKFAAGIIFFVQFAAVTREISNEASNAL
ncbi:MAG: hypothetical protein J5832_01825 [Clostridia bacterium]|nr:hypothetical protein [Clostridia bacterium]